MPKKDLHEWTDTGLMIGLGLLLVWDITSTNDNTKAIGELKKDVSSNITNHTNEVKRSEKEDDELKKHLLAMDGRQRVILQGVNNNAVSIEGNATAIEYLHKEKQ